VTYPQCLSLLFGAIASAVFDGGCLGAVSPSPLQSLLDLLLGSPCARSVLHLGLLLLFGWLAKQGAREEASFLRSIPLRRLRLHRGDISPPARGWIALSLSSAKPAVNAGPFWRWRGRTRAPPQSWDQPAALMAHVKPLAPAAAGHSTQLP